MIGRRGFIGALLGAAVLDPERLLWVPGKRMISIPNPIQDLRILPVYTYYIDVSTWMGIAGKYYSPRLDWIKHTYASSGWSAEAEVIKSVRMSEHHFVEKVQVTLTQMPDPMVPCQRGGNFYPPKTGPAAEQWWRDHPRYNGKPLGG